LLAFTGGTIAGFVATGLVLVALGLIVLRRSRRRSGE
jgi:hypothetical protein